MTSMLTLGLVWLAVATLVALPLGRLLRRADARRSGTPVARRAETEVLVVVRPTVTGPPAQPAAGPPPVECPVQPAHADPTISRTS